ncbi:MAG: DUF4160 domain-containing protein [Mesorhizobium amorphae]|nr:MAG: DUF4160 domain-containing protein [Mesorhizobium amorphae]
MPTVLREAGLRFHFFSGDGHEPPHVHVDGHGRKAKIWLGSLEVAKNGGFNEAELSRITRIVFENRETLLGAWNDFFA